MIAESVAEAEQTETEYVPVDTLNSLAVSVFLSPSNVVAECSWLCEDVILGSGSGALVCSLSS